MSAYGSIATDHDPACNSIVFRASSGFFNTVVANGVRAQVVFNNFNAALFETVSGQLRINGVLGARSIYVYHAETGKQVYSTNSSAGGAYSVPSMYTTSNYFIVALPLISDGANAQVFFLPSP